MKAIFHIHTRYSHDSWLKPEEVVNYGFQNGIDVLFITDHETMRGGLAAQGYAASEDLPIRVVLGMEIKTDIGDLVGIFLKETISARKVEQVIAEIKNQKGMVVLPHPYKGHEISALSSLQGVDAVEVFSSRTTREQDRLAQGLCAPLDAFPLAGCDAHQRSELANCLLRFDSLDAFRAGRLEIIRAVKASPLQVQGSRFIKGVKTRSLSLCLSSLKRLVFKQ